MRQISVLLSYADHHGCRFERSGGSVQSFIKSAALRNRRLSWSNGGCLLVTSLFLCSTNKNLGSDGLLFQYPIKTREMKGVITSSLRPRLTMSKFRCVHLPDPRLFSKLKNRCSSITSSSRILDAGLPGFHLRTLGLSAPSMTNNPASDATNDADWARWKTRCPANMLVAGICCQLP